MGENKVDKVINNIITGIESYIKLEGRGGGVRGQDTNPPPPKEILVQDIFFATQIALP